MLYSSAAGAASWDCITDARHCPLLKKTFDPVAKRVVVTQYMGMDGGRKPSVTDAQFVRHYYPWNARA